MTSGGVALGIEPRSTELRAEYCNAVAEDEAERVRSSRRAGQWLVGLGVVTLAGSAATYLATTQTEREQTDKTLNTLGSSLAIAGVVTLATGVVVLVAIDGRSVRARRSASLATDIAAEGELPLTDESDEKRANALRERNEKTARLFRQCLELDEPAQPEVEGGERRRATAGAEMTAGGAK
jgi:uncharacterized membrane protein YidH (DUF202 family)